MHQNTNYQWLSTFDTDEFTFGICTEYISFQVFFSMWCWPFPCTWVRTTEGIYLTDCLCHLVPCWMHCWHEEQNSFSRKRNWYLLPTQTFTQHSDCVTVVFWSGIDKVNSKTRWAPCEAAIQFNSTPVITCYHTVACDHNVLMWVWINICIYYFMFWLS